MVQDENGQMVHHGHDACQEGHHCGSCQNAENCGEHDPKKEAMAMLQYMQQHNQQHAAELDRIAVNLDKLGMTDVAEQLRSAVSEYQKGNLRLSLAVTLAGEHMKEV
jgi:positive regulator of sigma E activity